MSKTDIYKSLIKAIESETEISEDKILSESRKTEVVDARSILVNLMHEITTVQRLLGHTSVKTTEIYSEILSSTIVRDLKAVKRKRVVNNFQSYASVR